jgi:uncharacterized protein
VRPVGPFLAVATGTRLRLRVQPRASRDQVAGVAGDAVRVRLTAPPVDGAANEALVRLLADRLDVSRASIVLVSGHTGRDKMVEVSGLSPEEVARRLAI